MEKQSLSQHWDEVYSQKVADQVSWYQRQPQPSLQWIQQLAPQRATKILDVGGGASLLVDALLDEGYSDLTVLDISTAALDTARQRLGSTQGRCAGSRATSAPASCHRRHSTSGTTEPYSISWWSPAIAAAMASNCTDPCVLGAI